MRVGMPVLYEYNSIQENVELAKKLNLDFIELNLNFDYVCKELENFEQLKQLLDENNLTTTLHFYDDFDFFAPQEVVDAYLTLFRRYVGLASNCNLKIVNVHLNPGSYTTISGTKYYNFDKDYKKNYKRFQEIAVKMENVCKKNNCLLSFENTVMPRPLTKIFNSLNKEGFNFTYDVGHDFLDKERVLAITKKLPNFVEFHIHDADKKSAHLPIGDGKVFIKPFKELALALNAHVVIEVKKSEDLIQSVKKFYEL